MRLKVTFLVFLMTVSTGPVLAGLKWVDIGINGLTCSLCSRSVEMSLMRIQFVERVAMSLETTEARIFVKSDLPIDVNKIAEAVVHAGFSVRFLQIQLSFDDIPVDSDGFFVLHRQRFKWIDVDMSTTKPVSLQVVEEDFLPKKKSAEWKKKLSIPRSRDEKVLHVVRNG